MEIKGKVIAILPEMSGSGKNGEWKSHDFIIETDGQYPKKVCLKCFNKPTPKLNETVNVFFDVESREYNGKWFTNLNVWKFEVAEQTTTETNPVQVQQANNVTATTSVDDDLPF